MTRSEKGASKRLVLGRVYPHGDTNIRVLTQRFLVHQLTLGLSLVTASLNRL
jgi:hypothetical protein